MCGKLHKVSTLLTMVGLPNKPLTCGNGGFALGVARLPSKALINAVSSPQIYRPALQWTYKSIENALPCIFSPSQLFWKA